MMSCNPELSISSSPSLPVCPALSAAAEPLPVRTWWHGPVVLPVDAKLVRLPGAGVPWRDRSRGVVDTQPDRRWRELRPQGSGKVRCDGEWACPRCGAVLENGKMENGEMVGNGGSEAEAEAGIWRGEEVRCGNCEERESGEEHGVGWADWGPPWGKVRVAVVEDHAPEVWVRPVLRCRPAGWWHRWVISVMDAAAERLAVERCRCVCREAGAEARAGDLLPGGDLPVCGAGEAGRMRSGGSGGRCATGAGKKGWMSLDVCGCGVRCGCRECREAGERRRAERVAELRSFIQPEPALQVPGRWPRLPGNRGGGWWRLSSR